MTNPFTVPPSGESASAVGAPAPAFDAPAFVDPAFDAPAPAPVFRVYNKLVHTVPKQRKSRNSPSDASPSPLTVPSALTSVPASASHSTSAVTSAFGASASGASTFEAPASAFDDRTMADNKQIQPLPSSVPNHNAPVAVVDPFTDLLRLVVDKIISHPGTRNDASTVQATALEVVNCAPPFEPMLSVQSFPSDDPECMPVPMDLDVFTEEVVEAPVSGASASPVGVIGFSFSGIPSSDLSSTASASPFKAEPHTTTVASALSFTADNVAVANSAQTVGVNRFAVGAFTFGAPVSGAQAFETPVSGAPAFGAPAASRTSPFGGPVSGAPAFGAFATSADNGTVAVGTQAFGRPASGAPPFGAFATSADNGTVAVDTQAFGRPVSGTSPFGGHVSGAPAFGAFATSADNGTVAVVAKRVSILTAPGTERVLKALHACIPYSILQNFSGMYILYLMLRTLLKYTRSRK